MLLCGTGIFLLLSPSKIFAFQVGWSHYWIALQRISLMSSHQSSMFLMPQLFDTSIAALGPRVLEDSIGTCSLTGMPFRQGRWLVGRVSWNQCSASLCS